MSHGHFMDVCECGTILRQCRCPDPAKTLTVVGPCTHEVKLAVGSEGPFVDATTADLMNALTTPATDENAAPIFAIPLLRIAVNERYIGEGMMVGVCGLCCALIWPGADAAGKHVQSAHGGELVE